MLYNWVEQPIPGACNNATRCAYTKFMAYISSNSYVGDDVQYTAMCGLTAHQIFD